MCVEIPREKTRGDLGEWEERNGIRSGGEGGGSYMCLDLYPKNRGEELKGWKWWSTVVYLGRCPGRVKDWKMTKDKGTDGRRVWNSGGLPLIREQEVPR